MFSIIKSQLAEAFKGLAKVVPTKPSVPILGNIRFYAADGKVAVSATNLDERIECRLDGAQSRLDGVWLLPLAPLRDFLKGDGRDSVVFEQTDRSFVKVSFSAAGQTVSRIFETALADDWPVFKMTLGEPAGVSQDFFGNIALALPSAHKDDTRNSLKCVRAESGFVVATDGKQLVRLAGGSNLAQAFSLPPTKVLASGLLRNAGTAALSSDGQWIRLSSGTWTYDVRLVEAAYPNYTQIVPKESALSVKVVFGEDSAAALSKALPVFDSGGNGFTVLYAGRLGVKFMSVREDGGILEAKAERVGAPDENVIMFDRKFLLRAFSLGMRELSFGNARSPLVASGARGILVFMPAMNFNGAAHLARLGIEQTIKETGQMTDKKDETKQATPVETRCGVPAENGKAPALPKQEQVAPEPKAVREEPGEGQNPRMPNLRMLPAGNGGAADPFEELFKASSELKNQIRLLSDSANAIQKRISDAQKAVRQKERDFRSTREILDKLKTAASF